MSGGVQSEKSMSADAGTGKERGAFAPLSLKSGLQQASGPHIGQQFVEAGKQLTRIFRIGYSGSRRNAPRRPSGTGRTGRAHRSGGASRTRCSSGACRAGRTNRSGGTHYSGGTGGARCSGRACHAGGTGRSGGTHYSSGTSGARCSGRACRAGGTGRSGGTHYPGGAHRSHRPGQSRHTGRTYRPGKAPRSPRSRRPRNAADAAALARTPVTAAGFRFIAIVSPGEISSLYHRMHGLQTVGNRPQASSPEKSAPTS